MKKTTKYMMMKPGCVNQWDLEDDLDARFRMEYGVPYEIKEIKLSEKRVYVINSNTLPSFFASFPLTDIIGPFTREENPEYYL